MNANTGYVHPLPDGLAEVVLPGQIITQEMTWPYTPPRGMPGTSEHTEALLEDALRCGEPIVAVSGEVVQRLRLGDRELRRRKQRR